MEDWSALRLYKDIRRENIVEMTKYYVIIIIGILIGSITGCFMLTMTFQDIKLLLGAILGSSLSGLYIAKRVPQEYRNKGIAISSGVTVVVVILFRFWIYFR